MKLFRQVKIVIARNDKSSSDEELSNLLKLLAHGPDSLSEFGVVKCYGNTECVVLAFYIRDLISIQTSKPLILTNPTIDMVTPKKFPIKRNFYDTINDAHSSQSRRSDCDLLYFHGEQTYRGLI